MTSPLERRQAGVLAHITSLPGPGTLGNDARRFVDFLVDGGFGVWQTLPLGPTGPNLSPYWLPSVHAGNSALIDLSLLRTAGWLDDERGDRETQLVAACQGFQKRSTYEERRAFARFDREQAYWLDDFALYEALRKNTALPWWRWPRDLRDRHPRAMFRALRDHREAIYQCQFEQFVFYRQWRALRDYANDRGVSLFGDMPMYVSRDGVEVWRNRELFQVDDNWEPVAVSGVPPDYFAKEGQLWGNPLYDWRLMQSRGFSWWVSRIRGLAQYFDLLRIDHFRALDAYWSIPVDAPSARDGHWHNAPGAELLDTLFREIAELNLVAEDLGTITPEVDTLRLRYNIPGMTVLQFAFDGSEHNPYLPANHERNTIVYTGTHDNNTTLGWYQALTPESRDYVNRVLGCTEEQMPQALIEAAYNSKAVLAMIPMQDLLHLDGKHRMNTPGTTENNWKWKFGWNDLDPNLTARCRARLESSRRLGG